MLPRDGRGRYVVFNGYRARWRAGSATLAVHTAVALVLLIDGAFTAERRGVDRADTHLTAITFALQPAAAPREQPDKTPAEAAAKRASLQSANAPENGTKQLAEPVPRKPGDLKETPVDLPSQSDFLSFRGRLIEHIRPFHNYPDALRGRGERGVVLVGFMMQRDGAVREVWVESSSGSSDLDAAALTTIRKAQPLPIIPSTLPEALTMTVPLSYTPARFSILQ